MIEGETVRTPHRRTVLALGAALLFIASGPAAASDTEPGNNTCTSPDAASSIYQTGTLSSTDVADYHLIPTPVGGVVTNMRVYAEMNPGYAPTIGKNYDLSVG